MSELERLKQEVKYLKEQNNELEREKYDLEDELSGIRFSYEDLESEYHYLEDDLSQIQNELNNLENENIFKDVLMSLSRKYQRMNNPNDIIEMRDILNDLEVISVQMRRLESFSEENLMFKFF